MKFSKVAFEEVVSRVLRREIRLETVSPVAPWPPSGVQGAAGSVSVFMHRALAGAVFAVGVVDRKVILTAGYSPVLRDFCLEHRADYFDSTATAVDADALMRGFNFFLEAVKSGADSDAERFHWICGVEAAELLASLARVHHLFPSANEVFH